MEISVSRILPFRRLLPIGRLLIIGLARRYGGTDQRHPPRHPEYDVVRPARLSDRSIAAYQHPLPRLAVQSTVGGRRHIGVSVHTRWRRSRGHGYSGGFSPLSLVAVHHPLQKLSVLILHAFSTASFDIILVDPV